SAVRWPSWHPLWLRSSPEDFAPSVSRSARLSGQLSAGHIPCRRLSRGGRRSTLRSVHLDNAAIRGHRQQRLSDSLSGDGQRSWTMLTDPVKALTTKHPVD